MTRLLPAFLAAVLLSGPAVSQTDLSDMTEAESAAFGEAVRAYLMENPEVLMEAIAVLEQRQAEAQAEGDASLVRDNSDALFKDDASWVGGNPDGDVTIVEFLDYRCGYCKRAHPEVAELLESDGNIRLIVKEFPILGPQSVLASQFAIATQIVAGDDAYKSVADALMEERQDITEGTLMAVAEDLELDYDAIAVEMASPDVAARIESSHALGQALGIQGTPSFVFGDQLVRGYLPLDDMQQIVEDQRG